VAAVEQGVPSGKVGGGVVVMVQFPDVQAALWHAAFDLWLDVCPPSMPTL
jgi:hypothetical protein